MKNEKYELCVVRVMIVVIIIAIICSIANIISREAYDNCVTKEITNYEITLNDSAAYICKDYKVKNSSLTEEGEDLGTYEIDNYVLIYEDGVEIIEADSVKDLKIKILKTNENAPSYREWLNGES